MSVQELRQQIAQLEAELAAERRHNTSVGPAIQVPSASKVSLSEQVLKCRPAADSKKEEAADPKKAEGNWIPTNLRLLQAAMTQRAVTATHYAATKAAASASASEKVLATLEEKKVYSAHIKVRAVPPIHFCVYIHAHACRDVSGCCSLHILFLLCVLTSQTCVVPAVVRRPSGRRCRDTGRRW